MAVETRMRLDAHARPVAERSAVVAPSAPDLAALVAHYQRELRLLDWRLDVSYAPDLADSRGRPVWGLCYPTVDAKVATIVIRDPATPPDGSTAEQAAKQVTETVVHEMLHLHFAAFGTSSPAEVAHEEQVVWAIAEALINAKGTPDEPMLARAALVAIDRSTAQIKSRAAQATTGDPKMAGALSQKLVKMLLDAAATGDKKLAPLASAVLGELLGADPEDAPPPAGDGGADEAKEPPPAEPMPAARVVPVAPDALLAFGRAALALVGKSDPGEGIAEIARRSALAVDLETREGALARDRQVLELTERKALVASLVKVGAETPATSGLASGTLVPRLMAEPIAELRARVAAMTAARPAGAGARAVPSPSPAEGGRTMVVQGESVELTADEVRKCKAMGCEPEDYAALKLARDGGN